ncbi:cadherin-like beta sandwich domain-containing protein [Saccharibacillus sp. CPCC 101409]|uniref:cadherin-like beta sandwich domain-containing protein n=1 Tax=Saccharibacillus sp. CPCC 101409 TaxID=3058041 RepID=UPI00267398A2|nr:cadherin-like beta sandwich domain-containing protein [Saccharibacillus sp. CPCC 101409]MDO3410357.1 cadherin-like beta sandwich domain-containing protein [Saccharibacillus sp. CPCC 101409]
MVKRTCTLMLRRIVLAMLASMLIASSSNWLSESGQVSAQTAVQAADTPWNQVYLQSPIDGYHTLEDVHYHDGVWIAVGMHSSVLRSTNGIDWTVIPPSQFGDSDEFPGYSLYDVTFAEGVWVITGALKRIYYSEDGLQWTKADMPPAVERIAQVAYGEAGFVALAEQSIYTSADGKTWDRHDNPIDVSSGLAYGQGMYMTINWKGVAYTSTDGLEWNAIQTDVLYPGSLTYDGSQFWVISQYGRDAVVYSSTDGQQWTRHMVQEGTENSQFFIQSLDYSNGRYIATGDRYEAGELDLMIYVSSDGERWTLESVSPDSAGSELVGAASSPERSVVVGSPGVIYTRDFDISGDSDLQDLKIDSGALRPAFDPSIHAYAAEVASDVQELGVTIVTSSTSAAATINGIPALNDIPVLIPLTGDSTPVDIEVVSPNGGTQTYTLDVNRVTAVDTEPFLEGLTLRYGTFTPEFNPEQTEYKISVDYNWNTLYFTPRAGGTASGITVQGKEASSGSAVPVNLQVGSNTVEIVATAPDGRSRTYRVLAIRKPSSYYMKLSDLEIAGSALNLVDGRYAYTTIVPEDAKVFDVVPTAMSSYFDLKVDGEAIESGKSATVSFPEGINKKTVKIAVEQTVYEVQVFRQGWSPYLQGLSIDKGRLNYEFDPLRTSYLILDDGDISSLQITAAPFSPESKLFVNGKEAVWGQPAAVEFEVGENDIPITVVGRTDGAEDNTVTYWINGSRRAPANTWANLSSLTLDEGTLTPQFSSTEYEYWTEVDSEADAITLTPTVFHRNREIQILVNGGEGTVIPSGSPARVPLSEGENRIEIMVTNLEPHSMDRNHYYIQVFRKNGPQLKSLTMNPSFYGEFDPTRTSYGGSVDRDVDHLDVTAVPANSDVRLTIAGTRAVAGQLYRIPLQIGENAIPVVVTTDEGASKTYTIYVTRVLGPDSTLAWSKVYPKRNTKELGAWTKVAGHNGIWVAVGENVPVVRSKDGGKTWKEVPWGRFASFKKDYFGFEEVAYANGVWIVAGAHGNIYTSPDGLKWTRRTEKNTHPNDRIQAIAYGGKGFVALGAGEDGGAVGNYMYTSPDGLKWTRRANPVGANFLDVAYGLNRYVAVSRSGFYTSTDGLEWTRTEEDGTKLASSSITFDGRYFWAASSSEESGGVQPFLYRSYNGTSWFSSEIAQAPATSEYLIRQVDYSNSRYLIAVEEVVDGRREEVVYTMNDLSMQVWKRHVLNTASQPDMIVNAVASGANRSIVTGAPGVIFAQEF